MNIQNCIKNMLVTTPGEHCLFRRFGVRVVDEPGGVKSSEIREKMAMYYPNIKNVDISAISTFSDFQKGQYRYNISVDGLTQGG